MRNDTYVPVPGKEDLEAAQRRREDYAASRDQLAAEYNEAIAKRHEESKFGKTRCVKCGREFKTDTPDVEDRLCPDCR
jgi:hypothetical protein